MFAWIKRILGIKQPQKRGKNSTVNAARLNEALRQAKDNEWKGMMSDARRGHPGTRGPV